MIVKRPAGLQIEGMIVVAEPLPGCGGSLLAVKAILHPLAGRRLVVLGLLKLFFERFDIGCLGTLLTASFPLLLHVERLLLGRFEFFFGPSGLSPGA